MIGRGDHSAKTPSKEWEVTIGTRKHSPRKLLAVLYTIAVCQVLEAGKHSIECIYLARVRHGTYQGITRESTAGITGTGHFHKFFTLGFAFRIVCIAIF